VKHFYFRTAAANGRLHKTPMQPQHRRIGHACLERKLAALEPRVIVTLRVGPRCAAVLGRRGGDHPGATPSALELRSTLDTPSWRIVTILRRAILRIPDEREPRRTSASVCLTTLKARAPAGHDRQPE
jgi:hypothetical protein